MGSDWQSSRDPQSLRPSLPRSRHLPVAVTEGSVTRNLNETWGAVVDRMLMRFVSPRWRCGPVGEP